jgi:hypothetical protein
MDRNNSESTTLARGGALSIAGRNALWGTSDLEAKAESAN